jgi:hypothetical protein
MDSDTTDPFPGLSAEAVSRIETGLKKHYRTAAPDISPESWQKLKPILARYRKDAEFLRGFLNKGEASLSNGIATRSGKLISDLAKARDKGLDVLVERAIAPLTVHEFEAILGSLATELAIAPRDEPFLPDNSRERLYENFEVWWRHATGEAPWIEEGEAGKPPPTPFMFVAREVFNLSGMHGPTGASYKALKDLRRSVRDRNRNFKELGRRLAALAPQDPESEGG